MVINAHGNSTHRRLRDPFGCSGDEHPRVTTVERASAAVQGIEARIEGTST
jgi:hypothetical protein